ncbi:FO synthase [Coccomyxa sp. Obi]|nr:FO synthase [Coccomyxa sp. Obi]
MISPLAQRRALNATFYSYRKDLDALAKIEGQQDLSLLFSAAAHLRDQCHKFVTFSPKVFIPLTRLCRDECGYCTFAQPPVPGRRSYMTMEEVLQVSSIGAQQGATEVLFTLGDKPELQYPEARSELRQMGHETTLEYVAAAAAMVTRETGLLPHINAGTMGLAEVQALRQVSAGQGLMLETASRRLMQPGMPHHNCPDKEPALRLATIEAAGQAVVPYTSGILVGIGETRLERIESLLALRDLHQQYGHIQELIIQNFVPKINTAMADTAEPPFNELLWTVAVARLLFGPTMNIQAPPNLTPGLAGADLGWRALVNAGANDFGGISPLTKDYVNPEKPWPHVADLAAAVAACGKALVPRLTVYPETVNQAEQWFDSSGGRNSILAAVLRQADGSGLARGSKWCPGLSTSEEKATPANSFADRDGSAHASTSGAGDLRSSIPLPRMKKGVRRWQVEVGASGLLEGCEGPPTSPEVKELLDRVLHRGHELSEDEITALFYARGADFDAICRAADTLRERLCGNTVAYAVNRNINYTNRCTYACGFCAFSKGRIAEELRGAPYLLPYSEVTRRTAEAWDRGATEVCMQGGIHPDFTGDTYLRLLEAAKAGAPDVHVHAFSPLEVTQGAATLGWPLRKYLTALKDAGLGSLPGTAAEVLDDEVRAIICPDKLSTSLWLEVIETAHDVGLPTTSTIMFGHVDGPRNWARHLMALRALQQRTAGITEFVPLPFVHMEAPIYLKGRARRGPTLHECFLMHAVARLVFGAALPNIQASWVKMGPERAAALLSSGCNDMGGSIMNESITRAAGAKHGQELPPERMEELIIAAGRTPRQRTTLYGSPPAEQQAKSYNAAPLAPIFQPTEQRNAALAA